MKFLITLFAVVCIFGVNAHKFTEEEKNQSDMEIEACAFENGIHRTHLEKIMKEKTVSGTRQLNCFSACVLKKSGLMKENGEFNPNNPKESQDAKNCKKQKGAEICETGGKVMQCLLNHNIVP